MKIFGTTKLTKSYLLILLGCALLLAAFRLTPRAVAHSDLVAYITATQLFFEGNDPYSPSQVFAREIHLGAQITEPVMIWNPPILIAWFTPITTLPMWLAASAATLFSALCALTLSLFGWRFVAESSRNHVRCGGVAITSLLVASQTSEFIYIQNTSWLAVPFTAGAWLFLHKKWDFLAGALMAFSMGKPHNFLLPGVVILFEVMRTQRWRVVAGGFACIAGFSLLVELLCPGVWRMWLYRETWPVDTYGANFVTLCKLAFGGLTPTQRILATGVSLLIGAMLFIGGCRRYAFTTTAERIMWGYLVNPFFTMYGFFSDQVVLLAPLSFFICRHYKMFGEESGESWFHKYLLVILLVQLLGEVQLGPCPLSWLVSAPLLVFLTSKMRIYEMSYQPGHTVFQKT